MADFYGLAGAGLSAGASIAGTVISNEYAAEREAKARQENYLYNEKAANMADVRTRALYNDLYSPQAQLEQLKAAGLSPSLFYGDGGGISGQTGAQGAGASGVTGAVFGMSPLDFTQLGKIQAETDLINAQTRKTNEETKTEAGTNERGQAEIANIIAKTDNTLLKNVYQEYQNSLAEIETTVEASTQEWQIKNYIRQCEYLEHVTESARVKKDIDVKSENDVLAYIKERTNNIIADTVLKKSETKLTKQQVLDLINQITNRNKQIQINRDTLKEQVAQWGKQNELKQEEIDAMYAAIVVHGVTEGANDILNMLKFAKSLKGGNPIPKLGN